MLGWRHMQRKYKLARAIVISWMNLASRWYDYGKNRLCVMFYESLLWYLMRETLTRSVRYEALSYVYGGKAPMGNIPWFTNYRNLWFLMKCKLNILEVFPPWHGLRWEKEYKPIFHTYIIIESVKRLLFKTMTIG